jgi:hypothetical protein
MQQYVLLLRHPPTFPPFHKTEDHRVLHFAVQGLLRSYSAMYTLQRTPAPLPQFTLSAAIMPLAIWALDKTGLMEKERTSKPSGQTEESVDANVVYAIRQGLNDLKGDVATPSIRKPSARISPMSRENVGLGTG